MSNRIIGFDLARAYAILGMYIVNFNLIFSLPNESGIGQFLQLFNGNSAALFVLLSGMGVALLSNSKGKLPAQRQRIRGIIIKRSWFLVGAGLLLSTWWPADILHFYGGYMTLAAFLLFVPKRYYLWGALGIVLVFHILLLLVPYETGWDFDTLTYLDFWTLKGFLRNTFYNGWNPVFPWTAYFFVGMWLGRLAWEKAKVKNRVFLFGLLLFSFTYFLQNIVTKSVTNEDILFYLTADYLPPFLPFMLNTSAFAMMVIPLCMYIGEAFPQNRWIQALAKTGQMTFTLYVGHLTLGVLVISFLTQHPGMDETTSPLAPMLVLIIASLAFVASVLFSVLWAKKSKKGPLESLMRKVAG